MGNTANRSGQRAAMEGPGRANGRRRGLRKRALHEASRFVVLFLYLWLLFGLFTLYERIILRENGLNFTGQGVALLNALVLAKIMLVAEDLNLGRWLRHRRLIYVIVFEALAFALLFICFHVLEHVSIGLIKGESLVASTPAIGGGGFAGLASVATILFVTLMPYFAFQNVSRVLGPGQLKRLLLRVPAETGRRESDTQRARVGEDLRSG